MTDEYVSVGFEIRDSAPVKVQGWRPLGTYNVKALGEWIRMQRESWGLSQEQMAARTGLRQRKISRLERGEIADPGFADVAVLALWFGVSMTHIAHVAGLI